MKRFGLALVLYAAASAPALALGGVSCWSDGAGVGGLITDQSDLVDAVNCLGRQIAATNNRSASYDALQAQERQILELQRAVNKLAQEIEELRAAQGKR